MQNAKIHIHSEFLIYLHTNQGWEKVVQNVQTEPRLVVGYPKLYIGTARGEVWAEKKEYLFLKSPKAFLPYKKYIVKKQDIPIKQI